MSENEKTPDVAALTVQLLGAYLSNNTVASAELADLIRSTRSALTEDTAPIEPEAEVPAFKPAVSIRKSLASPDHLISLVDGKPYKTLKRHLGTHGLTPDTYRARYGLPAGYPMVAPTFAALRRSIAETIGLGNRRKGAAVVAADDASQADQAAEPTTAEKPVTTKSKRRPAKPAAVKVSAPKAASPRKNAVPKSDAAKGDKAVAAPSDAAANAVQPDTVPVTNTIPIVEIGAAKSKVKASPAAKAKKPSVKRMARTPKAGAAQQAPASADGDGQPAAKRRGKIGLFAKEAVATEPASSDATPIAVQAKPRWKRANIKAD